MPVVVLAKGTNATASSARGSSGNTGLDVAKPARTIVSGDRNTPNGGDPSTANEPSSRAPPVTGTAASNPLTPAASRVLYRSATSPLVRNSTAFAIAWLSVCNSAP